VVIFSGAGASRAKESTSMRVWIKKRINIKRGVFSLVVLINENVSFISSGKSVNVLFLREVSIFLRISMSLILNNLGAALLGRR